MDVDTFMFVRKMRLGLDYGLQYRCHAHFLYTCYIAMTCCMRSRYEMMCLRHAAMDMFDLGISRTCTLW